MAARSGLLWALIVCACGRPRVVARERPQPVVVAPIDAGAAMIDAALDDGSPKMSDAELEAWLREGCGPLENAPEASAITESKVAAAVTTFGSSLKGTIVYARGGELWLTSADGTRRRRLKRQGSPEDDPARAAWSPTGDALTFVTRHGDKRGRIVTLGAHCEFAHVVTHIGEGSNAGHCPNPSPDDRRCLSPGAEGFATVSEASTGRSVTIAAPKRAGFDSARILDEAWTTDNNTLYLVVRLRGTKEQTINGEKSYLLLDWSPVYRVQLPKVLPAASSKAITPEYFAPGDAPVSSGMIKLSPDETRLLVLEERLAGLVPWPEADVSWLHVATKKSTTLGRTHKLVGQHSWINDARWSPDGKSALLTVGMCGAPPAPGQTICEEPEFELVVADEKRVGFVARGRLPAWTAVDAL